jgi:hypothetical protein
LSEDKDMNCYFGHPDEWDYFAQHYGAAADALTNAHKACFDLLSLAQPVDRGQNVIYLLAQSCLKEFEEILLLAGNGYGGGATKLLRSFYERVVTLSYLAKHPGKIQQFIDYTDIHWRRLLTEAESVHCKVDLSPEQIKDINVNFERSRTRFIEVLCKEHNKTRLQMSWTKKPVPDQASEISDGLRLLCFNAYLRPTFYLHTTFVGITWQTQATEDDKLRLFGSEVERPAAREATELAHVLIVQVTDVLNDFFKLEQDKRVKEVGQAWKQSWEEARQDSPAAAVPEKSAVRDVT